MPPLAAYLFVYKVGLTELSQVYPIVTPVLAAVTDVASVLNAIAAASIPDTPSGTVYKFGGKPLTEPLGLFEHWGSDHKYTKIDLIYKELK